MIHKLIVWSLHNRLVVMLATLALVGLGLYAAAHLNVEAYPDPTPPLLEVISQNPGASPEEIERQVTIPIETALNGMTGLQYLRSTSLTGLSDVKCQFYYGTDYAAARQEVLNRLRNAELAEGINPQLSPWSPTGEIVRYVLRGPKYTTSQLKAVQDTVLERAFKQVDGVIDVTGFGGTIKEYQVLVDTRRLKQFDLTMKQVEDAIKRSNANVGGQTITLGTQSHNVRAIGLLGGGIDPLDADHVEQASRYEAAKVDDIRNVVVSTSEDGTPITVRRVAEVVIGYRPRLGLVGHGEENDVVEGIVLMRKGQRSLATAQGVLAKIEQIQAEHLLPPGMSIDIFNNRTDLVHVTTHNVLHNLLVGVGLVIAILLVFLGNLRSAVIVALVIPLALLFAITLLYFQGMSANLLSIGAVDFGIIVDSSVIIVETIYRHLAEHTHDRELSLIERISNATYGIERAMFYSTVIIVCAFFPLFTLTGPAGALFGPMALTYAFSILGALLLATTMAPVLCSFLFTKEVREHATLIDRVMKRLYSFFLIRAIDNRGATVVVTATMIAITTAMVPLLGAEFMPQLEEGNLWIRATLPRTVSREEASRFAPQLRKVIAAVPEVRSVMSHVGRPDDGTDVSSFFNLEFNVPLKPMEEWRPGMTRQRIEEELAEQFKLFPGIEFGFSQLIRDNIDEALSGIKGSNSAKLFGSDLQTLETVGARVALKMQEVRGIRDVNVVDILGQPSLNIVPDREACARYGVNIDDLNEVVRVAIGGKAFSQMVEGEKLFDIILRLPKDLRSDPDSISRIPIDVPGIGGHPGYQIPLGHLCEIDAHQAGASYIYRENNRRFLPIKFAVKGRDLGSTIAEARTLVDDPARGAKLPAGYRIEWSGEFAQMQSANALLRVTVPISIIIIMVVLYLMFGCLRDSLLVMLGAIVAMLGGNWALFVTGIPFSISAAVGFISIFGVVIQNGVLLINRYKGLESEGYCVVDSVYQGSLQLLRPILMISCTAILGLLPAALATSIGSQAQKPLAIVVVGGMITAMILPQLVLPVLYSLLPHRQPQTDVEL